VYLTYFRYIRFYSLVYPPYPCTNTTLLGFDDLVMNFKGKIKIS